jgi:hypothetical protein
MSRGLRRAPATALAGGLVLSALAATVGPARATQGPAGGSGALDPNAHAGELHAQITFDKRPSHPWNSRVIWVARRQRADGTWRVIARESWRAGSGLPGNATTSSCVKGHGWLPNGRYSVRQYDDWAGNLIHGRVFRLSDKRCANGTLREQLFIHTETGPGNSQCPDVPGDQLCRWEFPRVNDYTSHGCIKMSPPDLLALTRAYRRFFKAGVRYSTSKVSLLVR